MFSVDVGYVKNLFNMEKNEEYDVIVNIKTLTATFSKYLKNVLTTP